MMNNLLDEEIQEQIKENITQYNLHIDKKESKKAIMSTVGSSLLLLGIIGYCFNNKSTLDMLVDKWYFGIITILFLGIGLYYNYAELRHLFVYQKKDIKFEKNKLQFINKWNYVDLDLKKVKSVKVFKKNKKPNVLEVTNNEGKVVANIYLKGFSYTEINKFMTYVKQNNPKIVFC